MTVKYIYQALAMTVTKTKVCVNDDMLMDRPLDREKIARATASGKPPHSQPSFVIYFFWVPTRALGA